MPRIHIDMKETAAAGTELKTLSRELAEVRSALRRAGQELSPELAARRGVGRSLTAVEQMVNRAGEGVSSAASLAANASASYRSTEQRLKKQT